MKLTEEQVRHIARLARLHIEDEEVAMYQEQLSAILDYVETLQSVDTEGVEELQHAAALVNVFREDAEMPCDETTRKLAIDNFSNKEGDLLKVQAVFENRTE